MDTNRYRHYQEKDFLADDFFYKWVSSPDAASDAFWQAYLSDFPEKTEEVARARAVLLDMLSIIKKKKATPERKSRVWSHIASATIDPGVSAKPRPYRPLLSGRRRMVAGIAATLLIGLGIWTVFFSAPFETYQTAYGELKEIELSDGTIVNLNAHSSLKFKKNWRKTLVREVWLTGEAFFDVRSKAETAASFIVHTDDLDVEVTGTAFNVKSHAEQTIVVLEEGSVRLNVQKEGADTTLSLLPGQKAIYDARQMSRVELSEVETRRYSSWKEGVLIFDHILLEQAVVRLEEIYGKVIVIEREDLQKRKINVSIPIHNKEVLFETLETLFSAKVTEEQDRILIQ